MYKKILREDFVSLCLANQKGSMQRLDCDFSGRVVVGVTYGLSVEAADSRYIKHADATMDLVCRASVPGAYLCDLVPFLKYLPSWMPFQKEAAVGKEMIEKLVTMPFEHVKKDLSNGLAAPSLTQNLLSMDRDGIPDFEHAVKWTTGSMYGAMALNPEVQARAQAEIDRVVGSQRMPVIADKSELPYVNAVIKETMRWRPIVPLTLGRRSADDDLYRGFFIPRGAMVVPNVWAVAFEENSKYNPQHFIPERFLDPTQNVVDPASWAFGFGKRVCPGKALGENSVFIAIASILWAFKISPPDNGILNPRFTHKLISLPEPFECNIEPRCDERSSLLLQQLV
ncbi:hypothetical protein ONZ45_g10684 [Pleurotus djamor]|nr:hypothetical protein ONZ45_g10684 [Pleurotus djamor]